MGKIFKRASTKLNKHFWYEQLFDVLMIGIISLVVLSIVSWWILIPAIIVWYVLEKMIGNEKCKKNQ